MVLDFIRAADIGTTMIKLTLALVCGGILGIERGRKKRPAGFRTYMLVCLGSALVMMTNEYIGIKYGTGDMARMGSQVISGIGFLGAGTIIVTGHNRVKGLTTAAGLWAAACIGLAIGIGFYSGAILGCGMIFIAMCVMHNIDDKVLSDTRVMDIYVEFEHSSDLGHFIHYSKEQQMKIYDLEMTRPDGFAENGIAILMTIRLTKKQPHQAVVELLNHLNGVVFIEEL